MALISLSDWIDRFGDEPDEVDSSVDELKQRLLTIQALEAAR